jgi:hypothetical protein
MAVTVRAVDRSRPGVGPLKVSRKMRVARFGAGAGAFCAAGCWARALTAAHNKTHCRQDAGFSSQGISFVDLGLGRIWVPKRQSLALIKTAGAY